MTDHGSSTSNETTLWLQKRLQPGNWFDFAENDEIPSDKETPEINRATTEVMRQPLGHRKPFVDQLTLLTVSQ